MKEFDKLQSIAEKFGYSDGLMINTTSYCYKIISRYLVAGSILELGPAEGVMTELLVKNSSNLTIVEASNIFCKGIKGKFPNVKIHNVLFDDFKPNEKFDNIIMSHVLEHVVNPRDLVNLIKSWLNPGGIVFASVPNSHSLHRQAAVAMKLLEQENSLNESDVIHGHRRVFNSFELQELFSSANFKVLKTGGYWLKPLSNGQIEQSWSLDMINAFLELGEKYSEISAEIYIVASL